MLSSSVAAIIKGVCVFLSVPNDRRYAGVFKLLVYLGVGAHSAVLPRGLYYYNLSLLEGPSYLSAMAFHRVSVEFLLRLSRDFKKG